jgi:hypothetical protein
MELLLVLLKTLSQEKQNTKKSQIKHKKPNYKLMVHEKWSPRWGV